MAKSFAFETSPAYAGIADPRTRRYIVPQRIVWQGTGRDEPENSQVLLCAGSGQATVWARPGCRLTFQDGPSSILLDFGAERYGGLQLIVGRSSQKRPMKLRVRFGESVSEAMGTPDNDHALHDSVIEVAQMGATEFGNTGFRFARLDSVEPGCDVELKEIRAVTLVRDLEYVGSFECDDRRLNQIWETGAYTLHLCLQDYVWDGIKRDRLVWMGDLHPEAVVASTVFGKLAVVEDSLDLVRDETPLPKFMNGISSYSLWWIVIHDYWFRMHGDLGYLKRQRGYLTALLRSMAGFVDSEGREALPAVRFLDWPTSEDESALHAGLQALLCIAMDAGARLCAVLGEEETSDLCERTARKLRSRVPAPGTHKQVNALQVLAGMRDARLANARVLSRDPFRGISTFYGYYVLQARARAGDYQGCLDLIRRYWGGMLDAGATTFWEHFELDWLEGAGRIDELPSEGQRDIHRDCGAYCFKGWRHSLCHGWASGPTAWLSEHVLGIRPLDAGMEQIEVAPHLGDLKWARGAFPTPRGPVVVEHERKEDGRIATKYQAPRGVSVRLPE